jgi:hypothetical protein
MSMPSLQRLPEEAEIQPAPRLRRRRSSRLMLVGVLLGTLGALLGWFAYTQATQQSPVVVLARAVPYGQPIALADLREVAIPSDTGLNTIAWAEVDGVIGRRAATDLYAGQPLPAEAVSAEPVPAPGQAVIGVPVAPGQLPATSLEPRDEVLVISSENVAPTVRATVLRVGAADTAGQRTVDLLVQEGVVGSLARAAIDDHVLLVLVAEG